MQKMTWVLVLIIVLAALGGAWFYMQQQQAAAPAPAEPSTAVGVSGSVTQTTIDGLGSGAAPSGPQN